MHRTSFTRHWLDNNQHAEASLIHFGQDIDNVQYPKKGRLKISLDAITFINSKLYLNDLKAHLLLITILYRMCI